jgi:hypothetical protein
MFVKKTYMHALSLCPPLPTLPLSLSLSLSLCFPPAELVNCTEKLGKFTFPFLNNIIVFILVHINLFEILL